MTMPEDRLAYSSDKKSLIRLARENGLTNHQIIVQLSQGRSYKERAKLAKEWCEYLGISYGTFMLKASKRS